MVDIATLESDSVSGLRRPGPSRQRIVVIAALFLGSCLAILAVTAVLMGFPEQTSSSEATVSSAPPDSLTAVNPCPSPVQAVLTTTEKGEVWSGQLDLGPTVLNVSRRAVDESAQLTLTLPEGGFLRFELAHWLKEGIFTIPALSCPSA
jgi:hypothetical protein